jgi:hypothetical protein
MCNEGGFVKGLFDHRHCKQCEQGPVVITSWNDLARRAETAQAPQDDSEGDEDEEGGMATLMGRCATLTMDDDEEGGTTLTMDDDEEGGMVIDVEPSNDEHQAKKKTRKHSHGNLMARCVALANAATKKPKVTESILGAIEALTAIVRDMDVDVIGAQRAIRPYPASQNHHSPSQEAPVTAPVAAPVTARPSIVLGRRIAHRFKSAQMESWMGRPMQKAKKAKQCGFCLASGGQNHKNVLACPEAKKQGRRLRSSKVQSFINNELAGSKARRIPQGLVSKFKPVIQSIPTSTKWLVVHQLFSVRWEVAESTRYDTSNLGILIACLGQGGKVLALDKSTQRARWVCSCSVVVAWLTNKLAGSGPSFSPVFSAIENENRRALFLDSDD